jgi:hypothetical protein
LVDLQGTVGLDSALAARATEAVLR